MKDFWKNYIEHYRNDKCRLWYVIVIGVIVAFVTVFLAHTSPIFSIAGYILGDPLSYYIRVYHKQRALEKSAARARALEAAAKPQCQHEPLLVLGKPIKGTKRCKHCGLNEAYWG